MTTRHTHTNTHTHTDTHTHTQDRRARARARTHTHTHTHRCYDCKTGKGSKGCNPSLVWELKFVEEAQKFGKESKFVAVHVQAESSVSMALGRLSNAFVNDLQ